MTLAERVLYYVTVLNRLRVDKVSMPAAELISALEDVPPREVKSDFLSRSISLDTGNTVTPHALYWKAVAWRDEVEREALESYDLSLELPTESAIGAMLQGSRSLRTSQLPGGVSAAAAARLADLSFDVGMESSDLFLEGHGAARDGRVAYRHQIATAKRVLEEMCGVGIVADEVGLGKTIVAGLILEDLLMHEPDAHVLILVPGNLRKQWAEEELPGFFGRNVAWDFGGDLLQAAAQEPVILFALDHAKGDAEDNALATILMQRRWDLVILDEAHDCKNAESIRFRFVYSLRARRRVFLTATPVHNSGYDIFTLATLLKPGCLGPRSSFSEHYMASERAVKDSSGLQDSLRTLMTRTLRPESGMPFVKRKFTTIKVEEFKAQEEVLYDELLGLLRGIYRRHMGAGAEIMRPSARRQHVSQFVLIAMLVLREMASHPLSAIETLKTALRKRVTEFARLTRDDSDLVKLDAFISRYTGQKWDVTQHAKSERFLDEAGRLFAADRKFIVYVNYLKTHGILIKLLKRAHPDWRILKYEGTLDRADKDEAIRVFNDKSIRSCLVSTDAGGQGLNLQAADCVVNYDFPWNPMRVEQRVGRVDRASQKSKNIRVINIRTLGTVEEYVQIVLTSKLKECRSVLGDFSSPLEVEKIYEDKLTMGIGNALMESTDAEDMRRRMSRLGQGELDRYVGSYVDYEKQAPSEWTWRPRD
jgi:SNF2 family DNA or RNA helicase